MMGVGFTEMIIIAGIALVVIGPEKFPDFAKLVIRTIRDLRSYVDEVKTEVGKEFKPLKKELDALSRIDPEKYIDSLTAEVAPVNPATSPNMPVSPEDQKVMAEAQAMGEDAYAWKGGEEGLDVGPDSDSAPAGTVGYGSVIEPAADGPAAEGDNVSADGIQADSTADGAIDAEFEGFEHPTTTSDAGHTGEPDVWTGR